jgi:hypothetical protein
MPILMETADKRLPRIIQPQDIIMLSLLPNQPLVYLLAKEPKKPPIANAAIV